MWRSEKKELALPYPSPGPFALRRLVRCAVACVTGFASIWAAELRLDEQCFVATHNSYSGSKRGSILSQLDLGVRFIELDIHARDVQSVGDYRLGHASPGQDVALGDGNPESDVLLPWLQTIRSWSNANVGHAPLVIGMDIKGGELGALADCMIAKGGLANKEVFSEGDLAFLNARILEVFGSKLYSAMDFDGKWPSVASLRDRIIVVLSGDLCTRKAYRWDLGHNPSVSINSKGQIVEVHDSGTGRLWYWTGQYQGDGSVKWLRHGTYDTGKKASVALNNDGWIVAVHESESSPQLFYQLGKLGPDYEISWFHKFEGRKYDSGLSPTIRFTNMSGLELHEIHRSEWREQNWEWKIRIDSAARTLVFSDNKKTSEQRHVQSSARLGDKMIEVFASEDAPAPANTLLYRTEKVSKERIRYEQIAFVEHQNGDGDALLRDGATFCATSSNLENVPWALEQRKGGKLVRLWGFNKLNSELKDAEIPPANFPATDTPEAEWYIRYCEDIAVIK